MLRRAGAAVLHGLSGPPRAGAAVLHNPPRAGSAVLHGQRGAGTARLYNKKVPSASLNGAFFNGALGFPRAGPRSVVLFNNGARGCSRAGSAGAAALFIPRRRVFHNGRLMTSNLLLRRYYCTQRKGKRTAGVQAIWLSILEHLKNAPATVRAKLSRLLEVIKTSPGYVQAKWVSLLQSLKSASATVRAHWLYRLLYSLYAFLIKGCLLFDRQYKRIITYFPLAAAVLTCLYLELPPLKYLDFLNYICAKKCGELANGYQVYWLLRMEAALKNLKIHPRDEGTNKMDSAVQGAQLALKQAQHALKQAESALEAVVEAAEKAAAAAAEKTAAEKAAAAAAEKTAAEKAAAST